jgi:hypothetical protein
MPWPFHSRREQVFESRKVLAIALALRLRLDASRARGGLHGAIFKKSDWEETFRINALTRGGRGFCSVIFWIWGLSPIRKYDTIAISLLIFSAVLVTAICVDPKGFSLKEWQPIMAAVLALGGAGIVYRGAGLAYRAAMAKVEFDREINQRDLRRKARGILLKVSFGAHVIFHDTQEYFKQLSDPPYGAEKVINVGIVKLRALDELNEAWDNMHLFPSKITNAITSLRIAIFNIEEACKELGPSDIQIGKFRSLPPRFVDLRNALKRASEFANEIQIALQETGNDFVY